MLLFSSRPSAVPKPRTQLGFLITCLFTLVLLAHPVSGQSLESRPVARLVTGSENVAKYPRARTATISIGGAAEPTNATSVVGSPTLEEATKTERRAFEVTNKLRAKNGLTQLSWDPVLCLMARRHSEDMARLGFFSHLTPEGLQLRDRARAVGIERYRVLGENIAYNQGYDDPGAFAVERWMVSSGHRANILSRDFRGSAIGSFVGADGTVYLSQIFILR